jgi:hypothetical protein
MTQNVTLRMDSDLMRKMKHRAVDEQTSLSSWIADRLARIVDQDETLANARKDSLALLGKGVHLGGRTCVRETLYDR